MIPLGRILGAHGVHGNLKYLLDNPMSDSLHVGLKIGVGRDENHLKWFEIDDLLTGDRLALKDLVIREEAQLLKGQTIWIKRSDLPDDDDDEVYLVDLIGFNAIDLSGSPLGVVSGFSTSGTQTLVEIEHDGKQTLLPFVKPILHRMKLAEHTIVFDPPEGIFE